MQESYKRTAKDCAKKTASRLQANFHLVPILLQRLSSVRKRKIHIIKTQRHFSLFSSYQERNAPLDSLGSDLYHGDNQFQMITLHNEKNISLSALDNLQ